MKSLMCGMADFINDEAGVTGIEYALIGTLIAVVIALAVSATGTQVCAAFNAISGIIGGTAQSC